MSERHLSRELILQALSALDAELSAAEAVGEICLLGGTAMMLAFQARVSTKDVDALFQPTQVIREAAQRTAQKLELPADWLNDAAKGFLSPAGEFLPLDGLQFSHLRVLAPTPEYMLAMKVLAARAALGADAGDARDIEFLLRLLGIHSADEVLAILHRYYLLSSAKHPAAFALPCR